MKKSKSVCIATHTRELEKQKRNYIKKDDDNNNDNYDVITIFRTNLLCSGSRRG